MATVKDIKEGKLSSIYPHLYATNYDELNMNERFINLLEVHSKLFNCDSAKIFSTAGRTELCGNHTDHNLGKVLAASINLDTIGAVNKTDDNIVTLISEGFPAVEIDLTSLEKKKEEENTTNALIRGIAKAFADKGLKVGGFNANTTTSVLKGSGLSSSAAIEILCATIFNNLYNDDRLNPVELSQISQFAENEYYGKPSGLMDQIACSSGQIVSIDFKIKDPVVVKHNFSFEKHDYRLVIVNTKGNHENLTHCYASIPQEMKAIAKIFGKNVLREVDFTTFYNQLKQTREYANNDRAILRAFHYFNENIRVERMINALESDNIDTYLNLVKESGKSSSIYLQNLFAEPENQGLLIGLAISEQILKGSGACRVHGGGFAGTIQAYVPSFLLKEYTNKLNEIFGLDAVTVLSIREKETSCILN